MIKDAEASNGLKNQIANKSDQAGTRITIFHPVFDKSLIISDKMNKVLVELQIQSDINAISVLDEYNSNKD